MFPQEDVMDASLQSPDWRSTISWNLLSAHSVTIRPMLDLARSLGFRIAFHPDSGLLRRVHLDCIEATSPSPAKESLS